MPDFKIGSFRIAKGAPKGEVEVVYFATLPFAGSIARVGRNGLFEVVAAIEKQYTDHQMSIDLASLRDWMLKLSAVARLFEQVRIDILNDAFRQGLVIDGLDEERKRILKDEQDLEIFILDRAALDGARGSDLELEADKAQVSVTTRMPGI